MGLIEWSRHPDGVRYLLEIDALSIDNVVEARVERRVGLLRYREEYDGQRGLYAMKFSDAGHHVARRDHRHHVVIGRDTCSSS